MSKEVQLGSGMRVELGPGLWKAREKLPADGKIMSQGR